MAFTTPRTWVAGEPVTAAMLNEQVRDNLLALSAVFAPGGVHGFMIPAEDFSAVLGSPTLSVVGSAGSEQRVPAWLLDSASDEAISALVYVPFDPAGVTMQASIIWTPTSTNTGNALLQVRVADIASGEQVDQAADETDAHTQAGGGVTDALQQTTPVAITRTGRLWRVVIYRDANDAADTYTADAAILGVLIEAEAA